MAVLPVFSSTTATTGAGSKVLAGGTVGVTAADATRTAVISGAAGVGVTIGGMGGGLPVTCLEKNTRAALGANSQTSGDGVGGSPLAAADGTVPMTGINPVVR